jgi:hypothetical protein
VSSDEAKDNVEAWAGAALEAVVSLIPVVGGPVAIAVNRAVGSPTERKPIRDVAALRSDLAAAIERNLIPDAAAVLESEDFSASLQTLLSATYATANSEKKRLLRNALINGATPGRGRARDREPFDRLISRYDPEHVIILDELRRQTNAPNSRTWHGSARSDHPKYGLLAEAFGALEKEDRPTRDDFLAMFTELVADGMVEERTKMSVKERGGISLGGGRMTDSERTVESDDSHRLSARGLRFLRHVDDPYGPEPEASDFEDDDY